MSDRRDLLDGLRALGVTRPEVICEGVDDEAIGGTVRWGRDQARKGRPADGGLIAYKLKNGGLPGYGVAMPEARGWWHTFKGREQWIKDNVSNLDEQWAEVAIIGLLHARRPVSVDAVRVVYAETLMAEKEYNAQIREAAKAQKATKVPPGGAEGLKKVKAREVLEKAA